MTQEPVNLDNLRQEGWPDAADEIERLKADAAKWQEVASQGIQIERELRAENEWMRTALEPFARNVDAVSLSEALGHIEREHLRKARAAMERKP